MGEFSETQGGGNRMQQALLLHNYLTLGHRERKLLKRNNSRTQLSLGTKLALVVRVCATWLEHINEKHHNHFTPSEGWANKERGNTTQIFLQTKIQQGYVT